MKKSKRYLLLSIFAALAILLAACSPSNDSTTDVPTESETTTENITTSETDTRETETATSEETTTSEDTTSDSTEPETVALSTEIYYANDTYGFEFYLPETWDGFTATESTWSSVVEDYDVSGPEIILRHPDWTEDNPKQDIPILVFTHEEWEDVQAEIFNVSAAPIPPSLLGQNDDYVFALPARYNFAFPDGFEEVEAILNSSPMITY